MAIIVQIDDLAIVRTQGARPRGVKVTNRDLLNSLVKDSNGTIQFVRDELGVPVYLADVEIEDDGAIVVRSEALCKHLEAARTAQTAQAQAFNCICGRGC